MEIVHYYRSQIDEMRSLGKSNPQLCIDFSYPQLSDGTLDLQKDITRTQLDADLAALGSLIEAAATNPQSSVATPQVSRDLAAVMRPLVEKYPLLPEMLVHPDKYRNHPGPLCAALILTYQGVLQLPEERAGPILRYMGDDSKQ